MNSTRLLAGIAVLLLLAACAPVTEMPYAPASAMPDDFPAGFYMTTRGQGQAVYRIDSDSSLVTIQVHPGGKLAHLGHEHVVASHDIQGFVLWSEDRGQRRADIFMPLETLTVDEPELRRQYGLARQPDEKDILGTRNNLLTRTLRVDKNHFVTVHMTQMMNSSSPTAVDAVFTLNAVAVHKSIVTDVESSEGQLFFSGEFSIAQSEFGLKPFSTLGGLLQVKDKVDIHFRIAARAAQ